MCTCVCPAPPPEPFSPQSKKRQGTLSTPLCQKHAPVDARDVDDDVDHVGAELVALHVHGIRVRRHVDLGDHVEEEGFLG